MTKKEWWSKYDSEQLCKFHSDQFTKWWDPEKYDWYSHRFLKANCLQKFSYSQLRELLTNQHPNAKRFGEEEINKRKLKGGNYE